MFVIFLPGGALQQSIDDWTVVSTSSQARCDKAVKVYNQLKQAGNQVKIMPVGGITRPNQRYSEAEYYSRYLHDVCNIPLEDLLPVEESALSSENVAFALKKHGELLQKSNIILVSQLLHTLRLNLTLVRGYNLHVWQRTPIISFIPRDKNFWYEIPGLILTFFDPRGEGPIFQKLSGDRTQPLP